jgi:GNAT superfamily N-acetyltransferase
MRLVIRLADPADFEAVGELTVAAYVGDGFVHAEDSYVDNLRDCARRAREAQLWVAVSQSDGQVPEGQVLGTVTYCPMGSPWRELGTPDDGEFRVLAVAPQARGRGVGAALVQHCLNLARDAGHTRMVLSTLPDQRGAHRIYERFGFSRDPDSDWSPKPGTLLWAFRMEL